jgi:nucleoside-diphosphate-sugar epimerase
MRILVSGATGVIGRRAVPLLLAQGHSVTALLRNTTAGDSLSQAGARFLVADLFDVDALRRVATGHDAIINLATHMPSAAWKMVFRRSWRLNDRIRTEGARNLTDAALSRGIGRLIQESFALTYPDRGDDWIDERIALEPSTYNKTVLDAEASTARFAAAGHTGVVLRFAALYGPDAMQVRSYIDGVRKGWAGLPGSPEAFISSLSHDDAANAVVAALQASSGAYNVVDDEPLRRREYFGSLAKALELPAPRFMPRWMTPLLGSAGEAMSRSLRISNRKLKTETGWVPRYPSVREGWPIMLEEMKSTAT